MKFGLYVVFGENKGEEFPLDQPQFVIGRAADCDLQVDCSMVSRRHCELTCRDERLYIRDLDSHNGTFVNKEKANGQQELGPGDTIAIGMRMYRVVLHPVETRSRSRPNVVDPGALTRSIG